MGRKERKIKIKRATQYQKPSRNSKPGQQGTGKAGLFKNTSGKLGCWVNIMYNKGFGKCRKPPLGQQCATEIKFQIFLFFLFLLFHVNFWYPLFCIVLGVNGWIIAPSRSPTEMSAEQGEPSRLPNTTGLESYYTYRYYSS